MSIKNTMLGSNHYLSWLYFEKKLDFYVGLEYLEKYESMKYKVINLFIPLIVHVLKKSAVLVLPYFCVKYSLYFINDFLITRKEQQSGVN